MSTTAKRFHFQMNEVSAFFMYFNFALQGIASFIIAQQRIHFMDNWDTDWAGTVWVASAIGWGRLVTVIPAGWFSDKFGRKTCILICMLCYAIFFGGLLISDSVAMAFAFTFVAGIGNSFIDVGTYPALADLFPKNVAPATVILRAAITIGQFFFPMAVIFIIANDLWFGYTLVAMLGMLAVNAFFIWGRKDLGYKGSIKEATVAGEEKEEVKATEVAGPTLYGKAKFWIEGILTISLGFTAVATFSLIIGFLPGFAADYIGMYETDALALASLYAFAAFFGIFMTATVVAKFLKPPTVLLIWTSISLAILVALMMFPTPFMAQVTAVIIGLFAAGGLFQLALSILVTLFPDGRGKLTSLMSFAAGLQALVVPMITAQIIATNLRHIITFAVIVTAFSVFSSAVIFVRYKKLTTPPAGVSVEATA